MFGGGDVFHFNIYAFLIAFGVGMLYVYMNAPKPKVVVHYPSPYNAGAITYTDSAGTCFVFKANKVSCQQKGEIKPQPIID